MITVRVCVAGTGGTASVLATSTITPIRSLTPRKTSVLMISPKTKAEADIHSGADTATAETVLRILKLY